MPLISHVARLLERLAPPGLAEDWDNVGLLVGDPGRPVERVMTCLTITPQSAAEAVRRRAELIVAHHPLPFRPLKRLTSDSPEGRLLLALIGAGIAVYSPHTGFDSAARGINQALAEGLDLQQIEVLVPLPESGLGAGRWGRVVPNVSLRELAARVKSFLKVDRVGLVGRPETTVSTVAVACGSAGELMPHARQVGCDALVTGDLRFHAFLEAEATGLGVILAGHFASERFGVEILAEALAGEFPDLEVWASHDERDPLTWA